MMAVDLPEKPSLDRSLDALRIDRPALAPSRRRGRPIARGVLALGFVVALAALGYRGLQSVLAARHANETKTPPPASAPLSSSSPIVELTATGYVVAERRTRLSAEVAARIVAAPAREGETVQLDQAVFTLDDTRVRDDLRVAKARSRSAQARAEVARARLRGLEQRVRREAFLASEGAVPAAGAKDLAADLAVAAAEVRALDAESTVAAADITTLETSLERYVVRAPYAGILAIRTAELGDVASPGAPLAELVESATLRVDVDVPEARLGAVTLGGACEIVFDAWPDKRFAATVLGVGPRVARAKATGTVKVKLTERPEGLREDMAARVSFFKPPPLSR